MAILCLVIGLIRAALTMGFLYRVVYPGGRRCSFHCEPRPTRRIEAGIRGGALACKPASFIFHLFTKFRGRGDLVLPGDQILYSLLLKPALSHDVIP